MPSDAVAPLLATNPPFEEIVAWLKEQGNDFAADILERVDADNARLTAELARLRGAAVPFALSDEERAEVFYIDDTTPTGRRILPNALRRCVNDLSFAQSQHAAACLRASEATMRAAKLEGLLDCRAGKLLRKGKYFLCVASDEPYFGAVYHQIRNREAEIGRWTDEDERIFQSFHLAGHTSAPRPASGDAQ